jgi:hypothetical protein
VGHTCNSSYLGGRDKEHHGLKRAWGNSWRDLSLKILNTAGCQWFMPVILATREAKIRRIVVRSQARQMVCETLSRKNPSETNMSDHE